MSVSLFSTRFAHDTSALMTCFPLCSSGSLKMSHSSIGRYFLLLSRYNSCTRVTALLFHSTSRDSLVWWSSWIAMFALQCHPYPPWSIFFLVLLLCLSPFCGEKFLFHTLPSFSVLFLDCFLYLAVTQQS